MRRAAALAGILLLAFATGCPKPPPAPEPGTRPLPPDGFEGWTTAGVPEIFTGADLYGHIDGGAEIFLELGFEELAVQVYNRDEEELTVELYRMTDQAAATGIFLLKQGRPAADAAIPAANTVNRYQIQLQRGPDYVVFTNASGSERAAAAMAAFARFVAERLPEDKPLHLFDVLPTQGRVPDSERIIRGPFTLQAITTLGDGDVLELGGGVTAVAADYDTGKDRMITRVVAVYPSPADAGAALHNLEENLDPYLEAVASGATRLVWRDHSGEFGEARLDGSRLDLVLNLKEEPQADGRSD